MPRIVAFVLAGGEGIRLRPYTATCPKPALQFGAKYRIIDFVLSNLYHSNIRSIYVLAQYRAKVVLDHLAHAWALPESEGFVQALVPVSDAQGRSEFRGTADAVRQNLNLLSRFQPEVVAVFAADHIYRMDVRQMVAFHDARRADVTIAAVRVPIEAASAFGILQCGHHGRVRRFQEKPRDPEAVPGQVSRAYASMGNYLFRAEVLRTALEAAAARGEHDFGRHVLPHLVRTQRVYAYDLGFNRVPGVRPSEENGYWRDVGTVQAYWSAHEDTAGAAPRLVLENAAWPICPLFPAQRGLSVAEPCTDILRNDTVAHEALLSADG